jgi:hypothetical protein
MFLRFGVFAGVALLLMGFAGLAAASPPVPPPTEGFSIATAVDCEMSAGDFSETEGFTWTWVWDTDPLIRSGAGLPSHPPSTLAAYPGADQFLAWSGRAAQIRYTEEMQSTDTSFFQFKKGFVAGSESDPNVSVEKNYGYVASESSLIANAENKERVGLSIVANGDTSGLGDMPSLCPWATGDGIPATNEFIAMGSDTATTSVMVSDSETSAVATRAPEMNHTISAVGLGTAQALMRVALMEGDSLYCPSCEAHYDVYDNFLGLGPPNLQSETDYSEKTTASGSIDKFTKQMNYRSTIPAYQMPEPWYLLQ